MLGKSSKEDTKFLPSLRRSCSLEEEEISKHINKNNYSYHKCAKGNRALGEKEQGNFIEW